MTLTKSSVQDRLRDHPETRTITLLGEEYRFGFSAYAAGLLRDEDHYVVKDALSFIQRLVGIYDALEDGGDIDMESVPVADLLIHLTEQIEEEDLELYSLILYWGLRTFYEEDEVTLEGVQMVPLTEQFRTLPQVFPLLSSFLQDQTDEFADVISETASGEPEDGAEGN